MIPYELRDTVQVLYDKFSRQPYLPNTYWTISREFVLNPLYQHTVVEYVDDTLFEKSQHEFVLDTTFLAPPPGSDPGSPDFQSGAMTTSAKEASLVPGHGFEPRTLSV
jgi:hypothetical protein